ncbi:hypothetical protein IAU60_004809 [Kwoniella sp. DSM 27419]
MSDYKSVKEAFVADNPGSSIYTILVVSLVAWTSCALYASLAARFRPTFLLDYLCSALPLLLSVTIFAYVPLTFNIVIILITALSYSMTPVTRRTQLSRTPTRLKKSQGSWLDESDSDEEPAEPPSATASAQGTPIKLPSQVAFASALSPELGGAPSPLSGGTSASSNSASAAPSPGTLAVEDPFNPASGQPRDRSAKRRLSPQPSPDIHMVDILPTPPFQQSSSLPAEFSTYPSHPRSRLQTEHDTSKQETAGRLPFLSVYRAHMMLLTVICILAVDFPVFPRWMGKCEDFGTSLMDVGVGSFVFSLGLISTKSLSPAPSSASSNRRQAQVFRPLHMELWQAVRKASPVLALGLVRVVMVKGTEYPEHVTEYGVHWNFFFTIGLLPVFGVMVSRWRVYAHWSILGIGLSLVHQVVLTSLGVQAFLLSPDRPGLLGANKEGLASLPGYVAIYFIGLATGEHVTKLSMPPATDMYGRYAVGPVSQSAEEHRREHYARRRTELTMELFGYSIAWWSALTVWLWLGGQVSRRFANTPYVLFIAAYNTLFLLGYLLLETHLPPHPAHPLLEAINQNGLVVFLVANLGTGIVNLSMRTMYASTFVGVSALVVYSGGVCLVAWALRGRRIKI